MTSHNKDGSKDGGKPGAPDLLHFVQQQVSALSQAFSVGPLMQLRVTTPDASVTLVKTPEQIAKMVESGALTDRRSAPLRPFHEYLPDGEPGRAYDTVNAEVVGIFHAAPDLPGTGEEIELDRTLGYIEALKLRTPVKSGVAGRLVGQVVEEGQAVDFGETLFIVDSGPAEVILEEPEIAIEPPRI